MVWHRCVLDQEVQEPLTPLWREPGKHGTKPHQGDEFSHLGAVDRERRYRAVARQRECSRVGTIHRNRKLPECREARLARWLDGRMCDVSLRRLWRIELV